MLQYVYQTAYLNGTVNSTTTVGSVTVYDSDFTPYYPASFFVDPNGALWFGYTLYDTSSGSTQNNAIQGYIGKLVAQTFSSFTSSGNILISFITLLFVVMGSLWAF